jgi:hypothetical protein
VKLLGSSQGFCKYMFFKKKLKKSSLFSDFIRNASSRDKKRVYSNVLRKATDRQLGIIRKAQAAK